MRAAVFISIGLFSLSTFAIAEDSTSSLQNIRAQISDDSMAPALSVDAPPAGSVTAEDRELRKREDEILSKLRLVKANLQEQRGQGRLVEPQIQVAGAAGSQRVSEPQRVQLGMIQGATERQSRELADLAKTFDNMKASLKSIVSDVGPVTHGKSETFPKPKAIVGESAALINRPEAQAANLEIQPKPRLQSKRKLKSSVKPKGASSLVDRSNRYVTDDMPLAVINVDQADLWTGPSEDDTLLMLLPRNAQVAIETRVEEWYRVRTAQGVRAWLHGSVISFGPDSRSVPNQFIRIRAYDSSVS